MSMNALFQFSWLHDSFYWTVDLSPTNLQHLENTLRSFSEGTPTKMYVTLDLDLQSRITYLKKIVSNPFCSRKMRDVINEELHDLEEKLKRPNAATLPKSAWIADNLDAELLRRLNASLTPKPFVINQLNNNTYLELTSIRGISEIVSKKTKEQQTEQATKEVRKTGEIPQDGLPVWVHRLYLDNSDVLAPRLLWYEFNRFVDLARAVVTHWSQKADDRCRLDDDMVYETAGLPPADVRIGDPDEMLQSCYKFIRQRCEPGGWSSYAQLEAELAEAKKRIGELENVRMKALTNGAILRGYIYSWANRCKLQHAHPEWDKQLRDILSR